MAHPETLPSTLGALKASGWTSVPISDEIRRNAVAKIAAGEPLFEGVLGYEHTVMPQLENAVLAGHDVIFLGERGQAKTRMIRSLTGLLDEWMPIIAGSEINDDPYAPVSKYAKDLVAEHGDDTKIDWVHRSTRFGEKLATPDTSIADLIGEVDPIKVAEGRYLSDELTLHYGLVPRTNRGIFAINELPDLSERIQVGLLNILEERDIQVRGYKISLPIDVVLVASANPEDYTNRGRIITPLKDRFGSQIRTHYPLETETEIEIMRQEARPASVGDITVTMPAFMEEIVAQFSHVARSSSHVNQRSGVSVRLSVANFEVLSANALRRALRAGERDVVPRICDLDALAASTSGKIEIESLEEGREGAIIENLLRQAVLIVFKARVSPELVRDAVAAFEDGRVVHTGEDLTSADEAQILQDVPGLRNAVAALAGPEASAAMEAAAIEFLLEGLHLSKRLNKDASGTRATYRAAPTPPGQTGQAAADGLGARSRSGSTCCVGGLVETGFPEQFASMGTLGRREPTPPSSNIPMTWRRSSSSCRRAVDHRHRHRRPLSGDLAAAARRPVRATRRGRHPSDRPDPMSVPSAMPRTSSDPARSATAALGPRRNRHDTVTQRPEPQPVPQGVLELGGPLGRHRVVDRTNGPHAERYTQARRRPGSARCRHAVSRFANASR
ncbi:MAG: sigma 54-interacting transcriptional regulator [Ilumatobacteraceae bacterium]